MPEPEKETRTRPIPDAEDVAKTNPKIDVDQVREAQTALEELRKAGLSRQEYGITSPYERRPLRVRRRGEQSARG